MDNGVNDHLSESEVESKNELLGQDQYRSHEPWDGGISVLLCVFRLVSLHFPYLLHHKKFNIYNAVILPAQVPPHKNRMNLDTRGKYMVRNPSNLPKSHH